MRLGNNSINIWKFVESPNRLVAYDFENIWKRAVQIEPKVWKTECSNSRFAMEVAILTLESLFRIQTVSELGVHVTMNSFRRPSEDLILQSIEKCQALDLDLKAPVKEAHLEWLMEKLEENGEVKIFNTLEARFDYKKVRT